MLIREYSSRAETFGAEVEDRREFIVYLFNEALLCVVEDKRKGKQKQVEESPTFGNLRLKGRVYIKHIANLECSEADLSLTIHMVGFLQRFLLLRLSVPTG